jgi:hypothetical protein
LLLETSRSRCIKERRKKKDMSIQTNFRAQDMLGASAPKKKAKAAPRVAPAAPKVEEPVVVTEPAVVLEEVVVEEATSNEE